MSFGLNTVADSCMCAHINRWVLSALSILDRLRWIDRRKLGSFIVDCQDPDGGGISDRPGNMTDVFHTVCSCVCISVHVYMFVCVCSCTRISHSILDLPA